MTIALDVWEDGAVFRHPKGSDDIVRELHGLLDDSDDGALDPAQYLRKLQALVARHPGFIDGHAHLGSAFLYEEGKTERARDAYMRGFMLGAEAIPADFNGTIEWGFHENRPFLRAAHGVVLCYLRLGQRREALALMEKMLAWNPNDNQGVRYVVGSEYLRAGDTDKAVAVFAAEGAHYPPYRYEMALLLLWKGEHRAAATSLRHGFVENGYIAEILCGTSDPLPLAIWHGSNFAEPELARDYVSEYGDLWHRTPGAVAFLRWLHTHPKVMVERAAVLECREALLWEHDVERRRTILEREEAAARRIDDGLSEDIVVDRTDRQGRPVAPWLHSDTPSWP